MEQEVFDIVQIGRGPVGLVMAALVGQTGHRIAMIERHHRLYGLPRAGHLDHEIMRVLQSVDCAAPVLADWSPTRDYVWKNAQGETLLYFDWAAKSISGYDSDFMHFQPDYEDALLARLLADPNVDVMTGWEVVSIDDRGAYFELALRRTDAATGKVLEKGADTERVVRGRFLIGADGANSKVRRWLGVERDDLGFNEKWLIVDARKKREVKLDFDCGQVCDPARPVTVLPLGKRHRRWEWAMLPGESKEELERPETAWKLLAKQGIGPDDVEIIRQLVYTFEARIATHWKKGRAFLMGDAAHTMPPFMGQGMCSGMRDAKNLAWKLDLVLRGVAPEELLETYHPERYPHTYDWTVISLEAGKVPCTLDPEEARKRDELFRSGWLPPMPNFPQMTAGILHRDADGKLAGPAGQLGLQGRAERRGEVALFDDLFPGHRRADQLAWLDAVGAHLVAVGKPGDPEADAIDVDGIYAAYFAKRGIETVINRPDFYVFGGARKAADLPVLIDDLRRQLGEGMASRSAGDRVDIGAPAAAHV
jgi:2-polyprenyl-6-methoxyphenol hydroxylase-like FAD-dependent oxidoreductase